MQSIVLAGKSLTGYVATRLYVLADLLGSAGAMLAPVACNDDFCGYLSQLTVRPSALLSRPCFESQH